MGSILYKGRYVDAPSGGSVSGSDSNTAGTSNSGGSITYVRRGTPSPSPASPSSTPPVVRSPSVGSTGLSGPSSGSNTATRLTADTPSPPSSSIDTSSNARQTTAASSQSTSTPGLLDFDKMFEYQKRINRELDMPTLRETNREGYGYRKMEGDDQMGRDTSARRDAAALAMQRDVLSSDLERGTMRQQQSLQTRTKDQDLARAMSITMKGRR